MAVAELVVDSGGDFGRAVARCSWFGLVGIGFLLEGCWIGVVGTGFLLECCWFGAGFCWVAGESCLTAPAEAGFAVGT